MVGSYPPNPWGLHDMHGNLWELVQDCWHPTYDGAPTDGSAWDATDFRNWVVRGGSYRSRAADIRAAARKPGTYPSRVGFRIARTLGQPVDTDADGIPDKDDPDDDDFPLDPTEWVEADGDGVGDNADAFPRDPAEQADADGDGVGDNVDTADDPGSTPETAALLPIGRPIAGRIAAASDDDSGPGGRNLLIREDLDAGIYYVAVAGEPGDYAVMAGLGDAPDHGDTEATATLLTLYTEEDLARVSPSVPSALLELPGKIAPTTADVDVFRLDVPLDGTTVTVRSVGGTDVFARLVDSSLNEVAADTTDGNFWIETTLDAGVYYVVVWGSDRGTYRVLAWGSSASCRCADGAVEPDDGGEPESSSLLPIGPPLPGTIGGMTDTDVFRIDLQGSASLEVRTSGPTDTRGELLDATGARLISDDDSGPGGHNFLVRADLGAGIYYVAVSGEPGDYAVAARLGDAPDHGGTATATLLTLYAEDDLDRVSPSALLAAPGRIAPTADDVDVFRLDVTGNAMGVTIRSAGGTDVTGRLLDSALNEIATDASTGNFRIEARLDTGIYYVEVRGRERGTYRVLAWHGPDSCQCQGD